MKNQVFLTKPLAEGPDPWFECREAASAGRGGDREGSHSYYLSTKTFAPGLGFE